MKYQLVVFLLAHSVCAIPLQDFFPFNGPNVCLYDTTTEMVHTSNVLDSNGVSIEELDRSQCDEFRLSPNDDGSSPNISIGFTFPFFAKRFKNVFINTNGVISFTAPVPTFTPEPFPIKDRFLISPYWADVDIRGIGDVYFKETINSTLLLRANDIIQSFAHVSRGLSRFNPQWMLVATWYNVGYFSTHTDKTNTFQALLVTDSRHSFTVFNYLDNGINWTKGDATANVHAQVGFNFGGKIGRNYTFPDSRIENIVNIEEPNNYTTVNGQYVYRVDGAVIEIPKCDDNDVLLDPDTPTILNGGVMSLTGPCFTKSYQNITCLFTDKNGDVTMYSIRRLKRHTIIKGIIVNDQAVCPMPLFRRLGEHRLTIIVDDVTYVGEFVVVSAVNKVPDIHVYDENDDENDDGIKFGMIRNNVEYTAKWNLEQFDRDQFKENGSISFSVENFFLFQDQSWIDRKTFQGSQSAFFEVVSDNIANGKVTFKQSINKPTRFQFDLSVVVLIKKTRHLTIMYTSSLLSFVPKQFSANGALGYCDLWFEESNEAIKTTDLQNCPCTMTSVRLDPDFVPDPTCSMPGSSCHENLMADRCYIKSFEKMLLGQQCCYDDNGNYITRNVAAGSADYYFQTDSYLQHQSSDYFPYKVCCVDNDDNRFCTKYYEMRPKDNGTSCGSAQPNRGNAGGRGDPHFITLDGKEYTFNGLGEYTLLNARNGEFVINIQTKQAIDESDRLIKATSISVIAMKLRNKPVIQAQLDDVFGIKVLIESNRTRNGYREFDFEFAPSRKFNGGQVDVETDFSRAFTFENGVVIIIKASNDILSFQLSVPQTFRDNTKGLLGVWNGNQSDDFLRPDGTMISINSHNSEIFKQFGEMWNVDDDMSLIIIEAGFSKPVKDATFKPLFMTPVVDEATQKMITETCGGNSECEYDIAVTGIVDVGKTTLTDIEEHVAIVRQSLPIVCDPPCQNEAPCVANDTCNCITGFTGSVCERKIIRCNTSCENGGTCDGLEQCACPKDYYGRYCSIYNPCVESPCEQTCIIGNDSYTCLCDDGYILAADNFSCIKCAEPQLGSVNPTWHVALCNANTKEMICSGTAINDQWIVTSARCVCNGTDKQSLSIRFGKSRTCFRTERQEVKRSASEIHCFPDYHRDELTIDFALIKLQSPIHLKAARRLPPLCLDRKQRPKVPPGQKVLIYGWGRVGENVARGSTLRPNGMVTVVDNDLCIAEFKKEGLNPGGIVDRMICTRANTTSACRGNYGSAVITQNEDELLFSAVVSKSTKSCGTDQSFLIHSKTRNRSFLQWSDEIINS